MSVSKKIVLNLFITLNIFTVFVYLLACLVPYLNAGKFWFIAILGLGFPLIAATVFIFMVCWLLLRSKWSLLSLMALLLSWQQLAVVFAWHTKEPFTLKKAPNSLRVLSWNVSSWDEFNKFTKGGTSYRPAMLAEIKKSQADVLCFQEFFESRNTKVFDPTLIELHNMGYPYYYYLPSYSEIREGELGMAIFSKYPIIDTGIFDFGQEDNAQQLIYADIQLKNKTVRVFTIHLQSVRFGMQEYQSLSQMKRSEKDGFKDSRTIIGKLKRGYLARSVQADIVNDLVRKSPYPVILCGDFNDVPNSYTYFTVKGNMQDAFLKKGSGIGRTFRFISPTLRIDFIFADKKFVINQYQIINVPYSDHYGHLADIGF